jgi:ankyrin repeat protein
MIACKYGRLENIKTLVESSKDYGFANKNKNYNTGLHKAAKKGHLEILEYLHSKSN